MLNQVISQNVGWSCPKCDYCYSPITTDCSNCNRSHHEKFITTNSGNVKFDISTTSICACNKTGPADRFGVLCDVCGGAIVNYTVTA